MEGDEYVDSSSASDPGDGRQSTSPGSSIDSGNVEGEDNPVEFDTAVTAEHNYLGENLLELRGRTVLDDGSMQQLPMLPQPGVVLVPGQTLPLMVFYPATISMLRNLITTNKTFGVLYVRPFGSHGPNKKVKIGTTAEIYEYRDEEELPGFCVKAKGRQRFQVVDSHRQVDGNVIATVKMLPEVILPGSLHEVRNRSLDRYRGEPVGLGEPDSPVSRRHLKRQQAISQRDAMMTVWPHWVHNQYNATTLMKKVKLQLGYLRIGGPPPSLQLPDDPSELSYWVSQALPLSDDERLSLLHMSSPIHRLRRELFIMERCQMLCCQSCTAQVADPQSAFLMSAEGPQGTYVNSAGFIHETLTLLKAYGLKCRTEEPSTHYSWFPGYAWTIADCRFCNSHLGWKFTANEKFMKPQKFWGLSRRLVFQKLVREEDLEPKLFEA